MDEDRINPDGFEEYHVAQQPLYGAVVIHGTTPVFDDEGLSTKFLNKGKRLDEDFGSTLSGEFSAGVGHGFTLRG
jgi:hypothetical protein